MQLINAIVSTPDDLDFRLHLRNEFMRTGLIDALEVKFCCVTKLVGFFVAVNLCRYMALTYKGSDDTT